MKLETTNVMEQPVEEIRDAVGEAEAFAQPAQQVRQKAEEVANRMQACIRSYPLSAVWAAFAGGLIIGVALGASQSRILGEKALREPIQSSRRALLRLWPW